MEFLNLAKPAVCLESLVIRFFSARNIQNLSRCAQVDFLDFNFLGEEDCLYLNVYVPGDKVIGIQRNCCFAFVW